MDQFIEQYPPSDDCRIVFENLTRAHFVFHYLYDRGYAVDVAHTGHGALKEISNTNLKTDRVDAYKLALLCKDIWSGRKFIRRTHISSNENMMLKALVRLYNENSLVRDQNYFRIGEYMNLHNIPPHPKYKSIKGRKYREYLLGLDDPNLTMMVRSLNQAMENMDYAKKAMSPFAEKSEDVRLLMTMKGIDVLTAVTLVTAIDGIYRFDTPEKLVSYFGLGLVISESGGKKKTGTITKEGDPLVRKYMSNAVVHIARYYPSSGVGRFYTKKKGTMPHWKAVTAGMRKLTHVIWAMLTYKQPFMPTRP